MIVIKKRSLTVIAGILAILICFISLYFGGTLKTYSIDNYVSYKVVVDVGHGGIDAGVRGRTTNVKESDLNLAVSKKLANYFVEGGMSAVLTRNNDVGLYGTATSNLKRKEMQKRKEIICGEKPNIVISIHMNYYPLSSRRGAQVFYKKGDETSKYLANCIQDSLNGLYAEVKDYSPLVGDYYVLNCTEIPSVLVECGFLSNEEDEKLLITEDFQKDLAFRIFSGVVKFGSNK